MKAKHCDECKHFNDEDVPGASVCEKNHKPRWYAQKSDNPHDMDYGYKRKCEDYTEAENAGGNMTGKRDKPRHSWRGRIAPTATLSLGG